jgi:flavin reductase (DIM6/NTAB) family NADH-FMN oxidoreductase RutF/DNA-binding MarR family transcriptional regulator
MNPNRSSKDVIEKGDPASDARGFRRCLSQFATGIVIVTTDNEGDRAGVTVNSFSSVSLDPPLVLWAIGRQSRSFKTFQDCSQFAINVLATDQIELSRQFSGSRENKFEGVTVLSGTSEAPLIDGALAHLECYMHSRVEAGDHLLIIGKVKSYTTYKGEPLLFTQGKYGLADEHPSVSRAVLGEPQGENPTFWGDDLVSLVFEAHYRLSADYDERRALLNITAPEARILAALYSHGPMSFDELVRATFLSDLNAEDILTTLTSRGLLEKESSGSFALLAAGRRVREENRNNWNEFCSSQTRSIASGDVQRACKALGQLISQSRDDERGPQSTAT